MSLFGYDTTAGYLVATYDGVLDFLQTTYQGETTENTDVENGPAADMLRTMAVVLKDQWDADLGTYNSKFVTAAPGTNGVSEGSSLELLLSPRIGPKLAAAASTVVLELAGTPLTVIPAGHTVVIAGEAGTWSLDAEVTIGDPSGVVDGDFTYSETGAKQAIAGTTWEIVTPVTGWDTAGPNAAAAVTGRAVETDAEYRQRWRDGLESNMVAIVSAVDGVTSASMIEHPSNSPDAYWGLTHWVEMLVVGGDDDEVAAAIQASRAKGVATVGNTSAIITDTDYVDGQVTIKFSRPELVPIYVAVTITQGEGYPTDVSTEAVAARETAIIDAVVAYVAALDPGENTSSFKIASYINNNAGIPGIDNIAVFVDITDPPTNNGTLEAAIREQFTVVDETTDIDVTGA